jgi:hypothetical protein
MTQAEIMAAIASIRGAEMAASLDDIERTSVRLGGREIAHAREDGVDVRLSRARLIAAGFGHSALKDCRQEWTLLDPVPVSADHLRAMVQILASGPQSQPAGRRGRR